VHDYKETLERAIEKSMETRAAEAKYGSPGSGRIKVRREGIFGKPNERDLARVEAEKANRDRATLNAQHLADLGKYAASGKKYVMDVVAYMKDTDEDLPEDLQPIGQALTKISTKILTGTYAESLTMLSAMGMEENAQATKPGQQ
jgi:hypothetical protein